MAGELQGWQRKLQTYPFLDRGFVLSWQLALLSFPVCPVCTLLLWEGCGLQ